MVTEQGVALGTSLLFGAAAGLTAAAVALASVPEFVTLGPGPPLDLGLPVVVLVVGLAALAIALAVTVIVGARVVVGSATVDKLAGADL